jgi:hypothetical protein
MVHSLFALGVMALWLSGHVPKAVMKLGCYRVQTFLTVIHIQIDAFSTAAYGKRGHSVCFPFAVG